MNHSPAEVIVQLMINKNLGTSFAANKAWPIWFGIMPTEPDNTLAVYDTMGVKNGRIMETGRPVIRPGIQVRIRNNLYKPGGKKGDDIATAFDSVRNEDVTLGAGAAARTYRIHNIT